MIGNLNSLTGVTSISSKLALRDMRNFSLMKARTVVVLSARRRLRGIGSKYGQ